jgi:SEC-C motif domain protein
MTCPCGKGESLETCCGPFISGAALPETAEALMRSRYTAYATGNVDYILSSHDPATAGEVDRNNTETWSKSAEWLGLEITKTEGGQASDQDGTVEFVANYKIRGVAIAHRERAIFKKHGPRWVFVDGIEIKGPPRKPVVTIRARAVVVRNTRSATAWAEPVRLVAAASGLL